jgi:hypothetical protein
MTWFTEGPTAYAHAAAAVGLYKNSTSGNDHASAWQRATRTRLLALAGGMPDACSSTGVQCTWPHCKAAFAEGLNSCCQVPSSVQMSMLRLPAVPKQAMAGRKTGAAAVID